MTLDETIKHAEKIAEENQRVVDTGIVFNDVTIDMLYCDDTEIIDEHLANYQSCAEEYRQIAEWLKELKQLSEQTRWIPVSERLPEEPGEYLIVWTGILGEHGTKRTRPLMSIAEYEIYDSENYADWITTMYEFEYYHDIKVLAWMPLPEPYKAESEDKE